MKTYFRSSVRTNPDPNYYRKMIDRLQPRRDALLNQAEADGDIYLSDPESAARREADKLTAKIAWALVQLRCSLNMKAGANP